MSFIEDVNVQEQDTGNIDAFGRKRVSQVTTQFDMKQLHDQLPLFIDFDSVGTISNTHSTTDANTTLTTSSSGDWIKAQTKQRFNYQSGKSQLMFLTCTNFELETNVAKKIGYFSSSTVSPYTADLDGLYFESSGDVSINIWKTGTNIETTKQSSWNLDTMDGTGVSGITVDWSKNIIFCIDFEWLGVGRVRWGLVIDGLIYYVHESLHANETTGVYMSSPNQPLRWELIQSGAGSGTFKFICGSVNSEGSLNQVGKDGGIGDDGAHLNANNTSTWYYAIGIKLTSTRLDTLIDVLGASLKSDTNDSFEYRICMNPTYAGTVTYNSVTDYSIEYGLGATANTVSAFGSILKAGFGDAKTLIDVDLKTALRLGANIDGTPDELIVMVKPHGSNLDIHRAINWRELS